MPTCLYPRTKPRTTTHHGSTRSTQLLENLRQNDTVGNHRRHESKVGHCQHLRGLWSGCVRSVGDSVVGFYKFSKTLTSQDSRSLKKTNARACAPHFKKHRPVWCDKFGKPWAAAVFFYVVITCGSAGIRTEHLPTCTCTINCAPEMTETCQRGVHDRRYE